MTERIALWVWRLLTAVAVAGSARALAWLFSGVTIEGLRDAATCESGGNPDACTGGPLFVIFFVLAMVPLTFSVGALALSFVRVRTGAAIGIVFGLILVGFVVLNNELGFDRVGLSVGAVGVTYLGLSLYLFVKANSKRSDGPQPPPPAGVRRPANTVQLGDVTFPTEPPYRP